MDLSPICSTFLSVRGLFATIIVLTSAWLGTQAFSATPLSYAQAGLTSTSGCTQNWEVIPSANQGTRDNGLGDLSIISATDIWAVGGYVANGNLLRQTLTTHWDGTQWSVIPSPNVGTDSNSLGGVAAISSTDVWAVGAALNQGPNSALTFHWDGNQWSIVPNSSPANGYLNSVTAISTNDVWAVGQVGNAAFMIHWNGSQWSTIPTPNPGGNSSLFDIEAITSSDIWTVGGSNSNNGPLTMHWDGTEWSIVPSPTLGTVSFLQGVEALATDDVWAVGTYYSGTLPQTLTMHWDGIQWTIVPSPNVGTEANELVAVTSLSPTDVWAVGYYDDVGRDRTLTMHWNGFQWSVVPSPSPSSGPNFLQGVEADPLGNVWTVGGYCPFTCQTLVLRYPACQGTPTVTPTHTGTPTSTFTPTRTRTPTPTVTATTCTVGSYAFVTGSATIVPGTLDIGNHCDDCVTDITLPFPFRLYDQTFTTVSLDSNGRALFPSGVSVFTNRCLPISDSIYFIVPYWDDLRTDGGMVCPGGCGIFTSVSGVAPNRIFNIEWRVGFFGSGEAYFELRLFEDASQSRFEIIFNGATPGNTSATSGVQKDGPIFTQYFCNGIGSPATGSVMYTLVESCPTPHVPSPTATSTVSLPTPTRTSTAIATSAGTAMATPPTGSPTTTPTSSATTTSTPCPLTFPDVPAESTFYPFIRCLACRGIISGYGDGTFRPNNDISRGQIAKMVSNSAGFSEDPLTQIYEDVPPESPFYFWINRLSRRGHMGGYECGLVPEEPCLDPERRPYFRPSASATRGQLAKIVSNAAGLSGTPSGIFYTDVQGDNPFYVWIMRLTSLGVMSGYPCGGPNEPCDEASRPYFRPFNSVTRGQASKIVANTFFPGCQTPQR